MTTYSMPTGIRIAQSHFGLQPNTQTYDSPLSRSQQRLELPGARWIATYTLTGYRKEPILDLIKVFMIQASGGNTFYGFDPDRKLPKGQAGGTPLVNGASQTGKSLVIDGCDHSSNGWLVAGDYFSVNNELKIITARADTNASGQVTLSFEPALRNSPADNAALTVRNAVCTMRMADDNQPQWDSDHNQLHSIAFSGQETFV